MNSISKSNIEYIINIKDLVNKKNKKDIKLKFEKNSLINANKMFGLLLEKCNKSKVKVSIYSKQVTFNTLKKSVRKLMAFMFSPIIINL